MSYLGYSNSVAFEDIISSQRFTRLVVSPNGLLLGADVIWGMRILFETKID